MKTDYYIKTLLTIIAGCLIFITLATVEIIPRVNASSNDAPENFAIVPVNKDGSINVRILSSSEMDVNIASVNRYAFRYCTVPVEVTDQPIEVEID